MTRFLVGLMAAMGLSGLAAARPVDAGAATHCFRNGGFERGSFAGWTEDAAFTLVMNQAYDGFAPHRGMHYALLGPRGADGTLSQTFSDVAGQTLRIGFWLASDGGLANEFTVRFNGATLRQLTALPRAGWVHYESTVTATGLDRLEFAFRDDSGYLALDQVTVRRVGNAARILP